MTRDAALTQVSTSTLARLRSGIAGKQVRTPITRASLLAYGIKHQHEALEAALSGHSALACLSVLDVALAEDHVTVTVTSPGEPSMVGAPSTWQLPTAEHRSGRGLALTARLSRAVNVFSGAGVAGDPGWIAISAELSR